MHKGTVALLNLVPFRLEELIQIEWDKPTDPQFTNIQYSQELLDGYPMTTLMINNPDQVKNTIKLYEDGKVKQGIKTIIQEMMGSNEDRAKKFKEARLFNDIYLDTVFGVDQCTILETLLEGDQNRPIQVILDYMMAQEHSNERNQVIIGQLMSIIEKLLCQNISPLLAEHDIDNSDLSSSMIKLESYVDYEFNDFLGDPNIVTPVLNSEIQGRQTSYQHS